MQEKALKAKQEAKKQQQTHVNNGDTAASAAPPAGDAANTAVLMGPDGAAPNSPPGAGPEAEPGLDASLPGPKRDDGGQQGAESPFACVSAIMGWETFHMVHVLWIGLVDMPGKAPEKDWDLQVSLCCLLHSVNTTYHKKT